MIINFYREILKYFIELYGLGSIRNLFYYLERVRIGVRQRIGVSFQESVFWVVVVLLGFSFKLGLYIFWDLIYRDVRFLYFRIFGLWLFFVYVFLQRLWFFIYYSLFVGWVIERLSFIGVLRGRQVRVQFGEGDWFLVRQSLCFFLCMFLWRFLQLGFLRFLEQSRNIIVKCCLVMQSSVQWIWELYGSARRRRYWARGFRAGLRGIFCFVFVCQGFQRREKDIYISYWVQIFCVCFVLKFIKSFYFCLFLGLRIMFLEEDKVK